MGKILQFLFGKGPDIFDSQGKVLHKHPDSKWKNWDERYQSGAEYNWRNHSGTRAGANRHGQNNGEPKS